MSYASEHYVATLQVTDEPRHKKREMRELIEQLLPKFIKANGPLVTAKPDAAQMLATALHNSPIKKLRRNQKRIREEKQREPQLRSTSDGCEGQAFLAMGSGEGKARTDEALRRTPASGPIDRPTASAD